MKYLFIFIFLLLCVRTSKTQETLTDRYCDSTNAIIRGDDYLGIYNTQTINLERNVRAIGPQKTRITIYYVQPEDSIYDDGKTVEFIPRFNVPFKIKSEYNISASQFVTAEYFLDAKGNLILYRYITQGLYTCELEKYYFNINELTRLEKQVSDSCITPEGTILDNIPQSFEKYKPQVRENSFTKDDRENANEILDNVKEYLEIYYDLFDIEQLDKD